LVDHAAGDNRTARQGEIDLLDELSSGDLERLALLEGARLPVCEADVAALARVDGVASRLDLLELVLAVAVGRRHPVLAKLRREDPDLCLAQRLAVLGGDDVAADDRGGGRLSRLRVVARRRLGLWRLRGADGGGETKARESNGRSDHTYLGGVRRRNGSRRPG